MKKMLIALFALSFSLQVLAEQKASNESVEQLLELTESSKLLDAVYGQVGGMFQNMSQQMNLPPEKQPIINAYMDKVVALMKEEMSWAKLKPEMVNVYAKHFSQEEVNGLIAFYQTDVGKAMVNKMPMIMQDSMLLSQNMVMQMMPKIQALAAEMQQKVSAP
ncbi:DUF2059 domain-containing protein [Agaribacter flavus]|uniref:DUF2059 domain-containing protein n=1 Tax=Agaribacter flavus TaxID=1902781 RepID=A0ABV7FLV7_9ALTE